MRNKKIIVFLIITNIILIGIICSLVRKSANVIRKETIIIKEMSEIEYDNSITELNKSHEDYAIQVQENKRKIAIAITNQGINTSADATIDTMVNNIGKISNEYKNVQVTNINNTLSSYTITQNIEIPNDCNHGMLLILLDGGVNGRYYTSFNMTGDISNINTIYDQGLPGSASRVEYNLYVEADFVPNGTIELKIGTSDNNGTYYTTSKAILIY